MTHAFCQLSKDASLDTICGEAGRVFAARKANNWQTDFNTEIWYLAGDAMSAGFSAIRYMTKEQIAKAMGDSISRYVNPFCHLPKDASLDTICSEAGKVFAARKANNWQTDFNTEIWYLAGDAMSAGFSAIRHMMKAQIARMMGNSISRYINPQSNARDTYICSACGYQRWYCQASSTCHGEKKRY